MLFDKHVKKGQYSWPPISSCNITPFLHLFLNPGEKEMDFSEDMGILGIITITFPGESCDTLRLLVADKWSTGITLGKRQQRLDWIEKKDYLFFMNKENLYNG